jgi:putative peptidoglycan lipid II flippase
MLLKSGIIVSFMTLLSRVLGLIRDVVVANFMGAGAGSDVFFFANKIPNFLRRLFAEGAFAQAFVPVLSEVQATGDDKARLDFIAKISGTLGVIVFFTSIMGVLGSGVIAAIFGTGWFIDYLNDEPAGEKYLLASTMLKITFPYLFFITLTGLSGAILNAMNKFAVASFTPVLLNVSIIACAYWLHDDFSTPAFALAWGVFIGGVVQLALQIPFLYRAKALVKPQWGWRDERVKKVRTLMIPALFGVSVSQINLLFDTLIASFLMTGSISWLYYSDRLMEFPLGLFGIAIATIILPTLSRDHVAADSSAFQANMSWATKMVCLLGIPSALGLIVLAEPLLSVIFERGAFSSNDVSMAAASLWAYGAGLLSFMLIKVFAPGFYARQDTQTPVKFGIIAMIANMVFNVIFAIPYGYVGLAIATSLSATLNAALLYITLHRQGIFKLSTRTLMLIVRIVIAALAMVIMLSYMQTTIDWSSLSQWQRIFHVSQWLALAAVVFVSALLLQGVQPRHFKQTT